MKKTESEIKCKTELVGIDEICAFAEKQAATLIKWERYYGFPMKKNNDGIFVSSKAAIKNWYRQRKVNPKTVTDEQLHEFWELQQQKEGNKFFNYTLQNLSEISAFINRSDVTVLDLLNYED